MTEILTLESEDKLVLCSLIKAHDSILNGLFIR